VGSGWVIAHLRLSRSIELCWLLMAEGGMTAFRIRRAEADGAAD
jgi:hypothetical protein